MVFQALAPNNYQRLSCRCWYPLFLKFNFDVSNQSSLRLLLWPREVICYQGGKGVVSNVWWRVFRDAHGKNVLEHPGRCDTAERELATATAR